MRQAMTRTRIAPDNQGGVSGNAAPLGSRRSAGIRPALAALLLAAMVAPLGAWAADGQPAEGTTTPPSASATTDSNTGNSDAIRPGSGGGNTGVGGTDSQVSTDIQNSQGQGRFVLGEELPKARPATRRGPETPRQETVRARSSPPPMAKNVLRAGKIRTKHRPARGGANAQGYRPMDWEVLIPKDWEPCATSSR